MARSGEKNTVRDRWLKDIFLVVVVIMFLFCCIIIFSSFIRYVNSAELAIRARNSESVDTFFTPYNNADSDSFTRGAYEFVESFQYKDVMEVWVIDRNGKLLVSSNGFGVSESSDWSDYEAALLSEDNIGVERLRLTSGEPVTAMTYILRDATGDSYGAIRYLMSMQQMYEQLFKISVIVIAAFIFVVTLIAISGMYFVSSIVKPMTQICKTTGEIAKGDFSVRIEYDHFHDEIGELCASINDMALQLSEIDKIKNEFISTVSHEIRTPMTAIKGWGETLKNVTDNPQLMNKGLDIIVDETDRLSGMVEELLDFSRMQNGKIRIVNEEIDLVAIVRNVYETYRQKANSEKINMSVDFNNIDSISIIGDRDRIRQVMINILDNAIKYTPEGGNIELSVEKIQNYVKISVSDTGCGISKKDLPHIKDKFYKANNSVRGTGIGLAVADEIIKMHSGEIDIFSEVSHGTRVEILLPVRLKEE